MTARLDGALMGKAARYVDIERLARLRQSLHTPAGRSGSGIAARLRLTRYVHIHIIAE